MTFVLTGLDIEAKAALDRATRFWPRRRPDRPRRRRRRDDPLRAGTDRRRPGQERASGRSLARHVKDADERKVGRAFSSPSIELALASYPGLLRDRRRRAGVVVRRLLAGARAGRPRSHQVVVLADGRAIRGRPARRPARRRTVADRAAADRRRTRRRSPTRRAARPVASAPARATRAATPTSASGPATTPATPGSPRSSPPSGPHGCCPRPPTSTSTATSCPTCGRSTSCSSASSARASPLDRLRPPGQGPRRVPALARVPA